MAQRSRATTHLFLKRWTFPLTNYQAVSYTIVQAGKQIKITLPLPRSAGITLYHFSPLFHLCIQSHSLTPTPRSTQRISSNPYSADQSPDLSLAMTPNVASGQQETYMPVGVAPIPREQPSLQPGTED